eukprot:5014944-Amphidinium_carterae.1
MRLCCRCVSISLHTESSQVRLSLRMSLRAARVCCLMSSESVDDRSVEVTSFCIVSDVNVKEDVECLLAASISLVPMFVWVPWIENNERQSVPFVANVLPWPFVLVRCGVGGDSECHLYRRFGVDVGVFRDRVISRLTQRMRPLPWLSQNCSSVSMWQVTSVWVNFLCNGGVWRFLDESDEASFAFYAICDNDV